MRGDCRKIFLRLLHPASPRPVLGSEEEQECSSRKFSLISDLLQGIVEDLAEVGRFDSMRLARSI
jgi:hypothetical protein